MLRSSWDPSCDGRPFRYNKAGGPALSNIRLGYWPADFSETAATSARPAFTSGIEEFRKMGVKMVEIKLPVLPYREVSGVIARGEVSTVFEPMIRDEARFNLMRDERQKAGLKSGLDLPATQYLQATRIRRLIQEHVHEFFTQVDAVVCYTERGPAPRIDGEAPDRPAGAAGRGGAGTRPVPPPAPGNTDLMGCSNLLGLPGITLPCGFATGTNLPVALHVVGRPFEEALLVALSREYQRRTDWHRKRPPVPA